MGGAIRGRVLRENESSNAILEALATSLLTFHLKVLEETKDALEEGCALQRSFDSLLSKSSTLESPFDWVDQFQKAAGRFKNAFLDKSCQWLIGLVKEIGPSKAAEFVQQANPPASLQGLLKHVEILKLETFLDGIDSEVENTNDIGELAKRLKTWVSVRSLDQKATLEFFPNLGSKLEVYCNRVEKNILSIVHKIQKKMDTAEKDMEPYRLGVVFFWLFVHVFPLVCLLMQTMILNE